MRGGGNECAGGGDECDGGDEWAAPGCAGEGRAGAWAAGLDGAFLTNPQAGRGEGGGGPEERSAASSRPES